MGGSRRIIAYDALRVFAILTVVGIHTLMPYRSLMPDTAPVRVFDDLLHYAVPLFVFLSGMFIWGRAPQRSWAEEGRTIARRVVVVGAPFLAWSALYAAISVWRGGTIAPMRIPSLLITGDTWYHLYFIPMLVAFYLLTPLATRLAARSPEALIVVAYATRIALGPAITSSARAVFGDAGWSVATHLVVHLPHMALGAWFAHRRASLPTRLRASWPLMLAAGTALLIAASLGLTASLPKFATPLVYPLGHALTILGLVLGALAAEKILERNARVTRFIHALAGLSFGAYFVHPLLLLGVDVGLASAGFESVWLEAWFPVTVWVLVSAASFFLAGALSSFRATSWLIGTGSARRGAASGTLS